MLAAADKIDSVLSFFNVGLIPSGSNDPYALRRAVQGLIRIIEKMNWHFDLSLFIDQFEGENHLEILDFVKARIQKLLLEKLDRHDIVEAAINSSNFDITNMMESAFVIDGHKLHEPFKPAIENVSRSINLVKKAKDIKEINPTLLKKMQKKLFITLLFLFKINGLICLVKKNSEQLFIHLHLQLKLSLKV